jgi:hypothetical protein
VRVFQAGVTREQIDRYRLPSDNEAKPSSSHYRWYVERNDGDDTTWELEALEPSNMLADLDCVIRSVIDVDLYNREVATEREEMRTLEATRRAALAMLSTLVR